MKPKIREAFMPLLDKYHKTSVFDKQHVTIAVC